MWGLHYLFSFQQDSSTMVMKWAREKIFRFWSGFERGFFSSLCAKETMPKLDFLKMKKKKKRQNWIALGNTVSNTTAWDWCMGTSNSPGSLKSMNIHCMISGPGPVRQTDTTVKAQDFREVVSIPVSISWLITAIFVLLNYFGTYM